MSKLDDFLFNTIMILCLLSAFLAILLVLAYISAVFKAGAISFASGDQCLLALLTFT